MDSSVEGHQTLVKESDQDVVMSEEPMISNGLNGDCDLEGDAVSPSADKHQDKNEGLKQINVSKSASDKKSCSDEGESNVDSMEVDEIVDDSGVQTSDNSAKKLSNNSDNQSNIDKKQAAVIELLSNSASSIESVEEPKKADQTDASLHISDAVMQEENGSGSGSDIEEISSGEEEGALTIDNNSDVEEIKPEDPLAETDRSKDKENSKFKSSTTSIMKGLIPNSKNTIVVNDAKRLVEIAAGSKNMKGNKKEPTLVIIDTNSILSGKGGVPVSKSYHSSPLNSSGSSLSVTPIGVPQQIYGNSRTTITPVPIPHQLGSNKSTTITPVINPMIQAQLQQQHQEMQRQLQQQQQRQQEEEMQRRHREQELRQQQELQRQQQLILPTLTDDMFVVEAPSFIVPYVYEKPPVKPLKQFISKLDKSIKEFTKAEKKERKEAREKAKAEGKTLPDDSDDDSDDGDKPEIITEVPADADKNKLQTYFDLPIGKFFTTIGMNLVQEYVQTDLLRTQKRKQKSGGTTAETQMAINSLMRNLEYSKENNEPFHLEMKKCEFCNFKTESALVMQHHLETPHMRNYAYKCNYCSVEQRSPHDILYHMEAEHNIRGRLERGPAFHQCPNCPFEDNQKGKLSRHIIACAKKFRPERNLEPAMDWEPAAKIPRSHRPRNMGPQMTATNLAAMQNAAKNSQLPKLLPAPVTGRGRGRPPMQPRFPDMKAMSRPSVGSPGGLRPDQYAAAASMMYRQGTSGMMGPNSFPMNSGNQLFHQVTGSSGGVMSNLSSGSGRSSGPMVLPMPNINDAQSRLLSSQNTSINNANRNPAAKLMNQPSISITPLPRAAATSSGSASGSNQFKAGGKSTFVICEICDGYIKDLEQLRNHMQWIHKVKIHPKMIYNRPPLNCQKCQFRFFTDQGLERHLLGSHGLVTSSMQEAANKGKDAGRCPSCGKVYQWKLLNHVARDHGLTLKPAHLSYKCTVCTATFGMYKQFETHVYTAHSAVNKRAADKKSSTLTSPSTKANDSLLKPLKINDEITIIAQPAKPANSRSSIGPQHSRQK
ncbi:MOG interacting and ectopic P-granules protein 1 isoform X2 [Trichogramma pretiosum]|uniref:MOG interacting and ectopic P-granules protein 1 isoform X2 n=1 Tax=Trichogramma pretiosum TaxID=7493 RepID=UPI0006C9664B|nr:MOG interacting and ectopic P-granules protein 1 isoform X2 [Trichogramma pretiosum]